MGATAAHRTPERVVDGMHTQVWAWMTNKCRRRMKEKRIYNSRDLPKEGGRRKMEGGSWEARGAGSPHPRARGPFSLGRRAV